MFYFSSVDETALRLADMRREKNAPIILITQCTLVFRHQEEEEEEEGLDGRLVVHSDHA